MICDDNVAAAADDDDDDDENDDDDDIDDDGKLFLHDCIDGDDGECDHHRHAAVCKFAL